MNLFKAYIEGLGSKRLGAVLAAVAGVFLAPVAYKYLGIDGGTLVEVLAAAIGLVLTYLFSQWHLDAKTGGATSQSHLATLKLAQAAERALPDGTKADLIARAIVAALQKGAAGEPPSGQTPAAIPPAPPAPAPPAPAPPAPAPTP